MPPTACRVAAAADRVAGADNGPTNLLVLGLGALVVVCGLQFVVVLPVAGVEKVEDELLNLYSTNDKIYPGGISPASAICRDAGPAMRTMSHVSPICVCLI